MDVRLPCATFVGLTCVDFIADVQSCPAEDTEVRATSSRRVVGGNSANSARVAAALGLNVTLLTPLGDTSTDDASSFARATLEASGIAVVADLLDAGVSIPVSFITAAADSGSRTIVSCKEPRYRNIRASCVARSMNTEERGASSGGSGTSSWLHFEGRDGVELRRCVQNAIEERGGDDDSHPGSQSTISLELEKTSMGRGVDLVALIPLVDVVFISSDFAQHLGHPDCEVCVGAVCRKMRDGGIAVCAWGAAGAAAARNVKEEEEGGATPHICRAMPEETAIEPVDSVGAGDAFNAAFIAARLHGAGVDDALTAAVRVASAKVRTRGFSGVHRAQLREEEWSAAVLPAAPKV
mgnify:CR=1 FL=1